MEGKKREILDYYDELAREYDRRYQNPELAYMHSVEDEVLLKHLSKGVVLDIGSGTGRQSILLAKNGYRIIGIDISSEMIEIARAKAAGEGLANTNIDFLVATAEALPFKACSANSVISIFGALNHIPAYRQAYGEIARVLKPEGVFVFTVVNRWNLSWWLKSFFSLKWKWLLTALRSSEYGEGMVWTHYYSASELKQLLREVKFADLKLGCLLLFILPKFQFSSKSLSLSQKFLTRIENKLRWRYPFNRAGYYILGVARRW